MTTQNEHKESQIPLNQILYGPPGTGKTYQTIDKALEILLEYGEIESIPESREEKKEKFDKYKANGQIAFITFHQSFSYEEFVEGIKPKIDKNSQKMTYEVQNGIFKNICEKAKNNLDIFNQKIESQQNVSLNSNKTLWRLYTIPDGTSKSDFFEECVEKEQVWVYKQDSNDNIENDNIKGDYLVIPTASKGMSQTIRAFGVFGDFIEEKEEKLYRKVKWLWKDTSQEGVLIPDANFGRKTFQKVVKAKDEVLQSVEEILATTKERKPYILIIDEINRGNISKILGELITLIEPSKRIGENEALEVTLPYSQESFGVPNNLYIIGTMNTADRSIALLDTALRRRFEFIEMMPQPNLLQDCAGVNLQELLKTINHRIEFLLDREHTIGHAYFIGVKTLEELQAVFAKKIIPLLQEYFYEDYAKIDAVLNGNGMIKSQTMQDLEISLSDDFVDSKKKIYKITDSSKWDIKTFQNIYNNTVQDR